jgi:hypothetical protein
MNDIQMTWINEKCRYMKKKGGGVEVLWVLMEWKWGETRGKLDFIHIYRSADTDILTFFDMIEINESKLISNPIQDLNQEFDEIVINIVKKCFF